MLLRNLSRLAPRVTARRLPHQTALWSPTLSTKTTLCARGEGEPWLRTLATLDDSNFSLLQQPKKGSGFDSFTPRNGGKSSDDDAGTGADKHHENDAPGDAKKDKNFAKDDETKRQDNNNQRNRNNNNTDPNRFENWIPAILMLLVTYYLTQRPGADQLPEGRSLDREISWHDFLRLLQQQDVVKIVVTDDRQSARIYLKPNAKGLAQRGGRTAGAVGTTFSYEEQRRQRAASRDKPPEDMPHDDFHEQEQEQMEGLQSNNTTMAVGNVVGSGGRQASHTPFFYRMHIGSVESFERKLDEAQRALKRDPAQDVPVQYLPDSVSNVWYLGSS